jgi:hypothetical protein
MKRYVDDRKTYHIVFNSISEFFELTDIDKPSKEMHKSNEEDYRQVKDRGDRSWRYGSEGSHDEYVDHRFDGKKGKDLCHEEVKKVMASKEYKKLIQQAISYRKSMRFEDHGHRINVSKAISGEDRYFTTYKNTNRPTVKIAINGCGSACVDAKDFIKLAKTAVPTIYALEMAGICTEVYYTTLAKDTHRDSAIKYTHTSVRIKSAQERFNWTTFAPVFTLGTYRESMFLAWIYSNYAVDDGLGRPMDSDTMKKLDNFGYTTIIGLNAPGPVDQVTEVFTKIEKTR